MSNSKARKKNDYGSQRAEAQNRPSGARIKVRYNGHSYSIPHPNDWDLNVLDYMYEAEHEENPMATIGVMRELLGKAQWGAFKERNRSVEDIAKFMETMTESLEKDETAPNS